MTASILEQHGRDWLTPGEAASLLAVCPKTVRRWARQNWLTYRTVSPDPRRIQVSAAQVEELVETSTKLSFDA